MTTWQIISAVGTTCATVAAITPQAALDKWAFDRGYHEGYADWMEELDLPATFRVDGFRIFLA